jgi:hypothetical protein
MREQCARVLAAALMTGAIGFALAMPAILETAHKAAGRSLTAPPSSLQRSVHVVASAPSLSARFGRLEGRQPIQPAGFLPASRSGSTRNASTPASSRHSSRAGRSERAPKPAPPKPTPAPAPATRELADTTPAPPASPPAPSQPAASPGGTDKGKKKAKQHAKSKGKPTQPTQPPQPPQPPVAATTPQPANESPATEGEQDHGKDKDKDKDKGKSDDKGRHG